MVMLLDVDDLVELAEKHYMHALELIETDDIYDAAEKAWLVVGIIRKAFLVASRV